MISFPPYRPSSFELQLPGWPVIANNWRATELSEILGSLPEGASLRLSYRNIINTEALELLLLWRSTAGGRYPLNPLPAEVAAGVTSTALAARILSIQPLAWAVARPPQQTSVKNTRSDVDIELISELQLASPATSLNVACPQFVE